ncbi:MAG: hypothetical protein ABL890_02005 [Candidatus Peribacteraceae bacterium]
MPKLYTNQQVAAANSIVRHVTSHPAVPFVLEGVSGVGKSTAAALAAEQLELSALQIHEFDRLRHYERDLDESKIAVVDCRSAEQVKSVIDDISGKVGGIVINAHPQVVDKRSTRLVNHVEEFQKHNVHVDIHRLQIMGTDEVREYLGETAPELDDKKNKIVRDYGLGIFGHIRNLLSLDTLDATNAEFLTITKIKQVLSHAGAQLLYPAEQAVAILQRAFPHAIADRLKKSDNFEDVISAIVNTEGYRFPFPRVHKTFEIYRELKESCAGITIYIPNVDQETLDELYIKNEDDEISGRIVRFHPNVGVPWGTTRISIVGNNFTSDESYRTMHAKERFNEWLAGKITEAPNHGENPMYVRTTAHGGCDTLDHLFGMYAIETLLQGKSIPYEVRYAAGEAPFKAGGFCNRIIMQINGDIIEKEVTH